MNTAPTHSPAHRRLVRTAAMLASGAIALAACGDDPAPISTPAGTQAPVVVVGPAAEAEPPPTPPPSTTPTTSPAPIDAVVKISQTVLGDVLSDAGGKTLYAFTNDVESRSTCYGTCAEAWPPVLVDPNFIVSPGLDSGIFATTERDDGTFQLVAGKYPLYLYAADAKPGDITGQGSGDVWYAVDTTGRIITEPGPDATDSGYGQPVATEPAAAPVADPVVQLGETELGQILTDQAGMTLYLFTPDEAGAPTCVDGCAEAWPPLLVDDVAELLAGEGIDTAMLSTVEHPGGGQQLKIGKWPLYRFGGDAAPGETNGQGSGDKWFVVGADGKSIT